MPPIRTNEIIDLSSSSPVPSSPPPVRVQTRSQSRARSVGIRTTPESVAAGSGKNVPTANNAKRRKGKQPIKTLGPVIELTDSEDEKEQDKIKLPGPSGTQNQAENNKASSSSSSSLFASGNGSSSNSSVMPHATNVVNVIKEPPHLAVTDADKIDDKEKQSDIGNVDNGSKGKGKDKGKETATLAKEDSFQNAPFPRVMDFGRGVDEERLVAGPSTQPQPAAQAPALPAIPPPAMPAPALIDSEPDPVVDPPTQTLARVVEVMPHIDPDFLYPLIETHLPTFQSDPVRTAEFILGAVFEMGIDNIPKAKDAAKGKGKRKSEGGEPGDAPRQENGDERTSKRTRVDWASVDRPFRGTDKYVELALIHLQTSFPHIPKRHLRHQLDLHGSHYAPTHLALSVAEKENKRGYRPKSTRYNPERDRLKLTTWKDEVLEEERRWIVESEAGGKEMSADGGADKPDKGKGKAIDIGVNEDEESLEEGEGIECQCCFAEYPFAKMVQCPEAHLFCTTCISQYASTQLGSHCASLICMHPSECKQPFPESELRRVLDSKLMDLYERVKQQKEIEDAGLEGLEECPFCEYKCVIEASKEEEKLFRCGNEEGGCGVVSCRMCKKEDHLPKSCKEVEEDKHLDNQHAVEEAMTQALMRQCPKCKKPFIKDAGCNKMTCPHCSTMSCYVCRQIIRGYDHFDQTQPNAPSSSRRNGKCLLWDAVEQRHADEVKAAAEKALAEFKKNNPDANADAIKVDIPKAPPAARPGVVPQYLGNNAFNIGAMNAHQARIRQMAQQQQQQALAGGVFAGMYGPAIPPVMQPVVLPPARPVIAPAPAPAARRAAAAVAHARRNAANRRKAANADGQIVANHIANNAQREPAPIPLGRVPPPVIHNPQQGAPGPLVQVHRMQQVVPPPAPNIIVPNVHHHFQFDLAAVHATTAREPIGRQLPLQVPLPFQGVHFMDAQYQRRLQEVAEANERFRQRMAAEQGRFHNVLPGDNRPLLFGDWKPGQVGGGGGGGFGPAAVAPNPAPAIAMDNERQLLPMETQQRVMRERMVLLQQEQQRQIGVEQNRERAYAEALMTYQADGPRAVGVGALGGGDAGFPAMGFMPVVHQEFGGHLNQHQAMQ